jgi:hypothetical protein
LRHTELIFIPEKINPQVMVQKEANCDGGKLLCSAWKQTDHMRTAGSDEERGAKIHVREIFEKLKVY